MKRYILLIVLSLSSALGIPNETNHGAHEAYIVCAGLFKIVEPTPLIEDPEVTQGRRRELSSNLVFTNIGNTIKASKNITFGILYSAYGDERQTVIKVKRIIKHPPMKHPQSGQIITESTSPSEWMYNMSILPLVYTFDDDWEMVEGEWIFGLHSDDKILARQAFIVSK